MKNFWISLFILTSVVLFPAIVQAGADLKFTKNREFCVVSVDASIIRLEVAYGWDRERIGYEDKQAIAYFTGPFFEQDSVNSRECAIIGDIYFDNKLKLATPDSREFADRRYHVAITKTGRLEFGYGGWKPQYKENFDFFLGGLGYVYSENGPKVDYLDPYATSTIQELHNFIPRERMLVGKKDNNLVIVRTVPISMSEALNVARGLNMTEVYFLDQGNRARLIVPHQRMEAVKFNVPYLIRMSNKFTSPPLFAPI